MPIGPGAPQVTKDIGIFRLTDQANPAPDRYVIAPVGLNNLRGYAISGVNPVGQRAIFAGYGDTGIGNWGNSSDAVQGLTFNNLPAAAGNFRLSFTPPGGGAAQVTANINAVGLTAAGLAGALEALPALAPIPGVGGAPPTRRVEAIRWNANEFSIRFIGPGIGGRAIAPLGVTVAPGQGAFGVVRSTTWAGGFTPAKRTGEQVIERVLGLAGVPAAVAANYVEADFDNGFAAQSSLGGFGLPDEGTIGLGDSGGPAFRRNAANALEIIGINQGTYRTTSPPDLNDWIFSNGNPGPPDGSFGEFSMFTAARNFNNAGGFIDTITNNQPYDLILDMSKQVIGADLAGENVTINVRRVGANLVIEVTDPLGAYSGVYYQDAAARIRSLLIRGTNDNETVNLGNNLLGPGRRVRFEGGGGNDTTNVARLEAGNGGDLIAFNGGDGDDTLQIEDQVGNAGLAYLVSALSVTAADLNIDEYDGTEHLVLLAGGLDDTVSVSGLSTQTTLLGGGGGNDTLTLNTFSTITGLTVEGIDGYDVLAVASGYVLNPVLLNLEAIQITGGTLQLDNDLTILDYDQSAGTFTGAGHLTASSSLDWSGGTMSGNGITTLTAGGVLTFNGGVKTLLSRALKNGGTGVWSSGDIVGGSGTIHNLAGGFFAGHGIFYGGLLNDGLLSPGGSGAAGVVTIGGSFTQTAGGALNVEFNTSGGADLLSVSGVVTLAGSLQASLLPGSGVGAFTAINNTGAGPIIGAFAGLPEGAAFNLAGYLYRITYLGGTGNDVVLIPVTASPGQWAHCVMGVSSEFGPSPGDYSAARALGAPDVFAYGDNPKAWSPGSLNNTQEYIKLCFLNPVNGQGVTIREVNGNGFVTQVDLVDTNGNEYPIWAGADPNQPGSPGELTIAFPATTFLVKGVKIYVNTNHDLNAWEQIDAVMLHGEAGGGGFATTGPSTGPAGLTSTVVSGLRRLSAGPVATLTTVGPVRLGSPVTFRFTGQRDRPGGGPVSGLRYSFDFNNDGDFADPGEIQDGSQPSAQHTFTTRGWHVVHARVKNRDGLFTDFWIRVFVS